MATTNLTLQGVTAGTIWTSTPMWYPEYDWTGYSYFALSNVPADFVKANTVTFKAGYLRINPTPADDTETLTITVRDINGNALTNTLTYVNRTSTAALSDPFTLTAAGLAGTATTWNGAYLDITGDHSASMGSDGTRWEMQNNDALTHIQIDYEQDLSFVVDTADGATVDSDTDKLEFHGVGGTDLRFQAMIYENGSEQYHSQSIADGYYALYSWRGMYVDIQSILDKQLMIFRCKLSMTGTVTGNVVIELRNAIGLYNSTGTPGSIIYETISIPAESIPAASTDFEVMFRTPVTGAAGVRYCVYVYFSGGDASNYIRLYRTSSLSGYGGGFSTTYGVFTYHQNYNMYFRAFWYTLKEAKDSLYDPASFTSADGAPYLSDELVDYIFDGGTLGLVDGTYGWKARAMDSNGAGGGRWEPWVVQTFVYDLLIQDLFITALIEVSNSISDMSGLVDYYGSISALIAASFSVTEISGEMTLGPTILSSPADTVTGLVAPITLVWLDYFGATTYQLQIATDVDFTSIVVDKYLDALTFIFNNAQPSTEYFWRVRAVIPPTVRY